MFTRIPYENYEEWLKLRQKGIGGSDAPIILGFSNWKSNLDLYKEKCGLIQKNCEDSNEFVEYGKNAEKPLRDLFQAKFIGTFQVTTSDDVLVRNDKNYLRASLDGEIEVLKDFEFLGSDHIYTPLKKGMKGIYEGKTRYLPNSNEWKTTIPMNYFVQVLHYLLVTDYDFVIINAELTFKDCSIIKTFCFLKKDKLNDLAFLEQKEDEFWNMVESKKEPPLIINL